MKKISFLLLMCLTINSLFAQDFPYNDNKKIEFEEVIDFKDGLTKEKIIVRTEKWANSYWSEPNLVNKTEKSISYKASSKSSTNILWAKNTFEVFYIVKIDVKENKFRYTLTDFELVELGLMKFPLEKKIKKKKIKEFVWSETQKLIESFKSAVQSGNIETEKDNW